ncbi:alpha/beta fold hydrolase [uncultured Pontibacter sp.]|uniref:alpha/beta hydrolase family protein n=1 Tax=uncultured Pontibacter sp. TaxID=453356 RepID=UPI00262DDC51|nr:alpha/beta fold hydrolase [uncultured Pontibacter sp.]
MKTPSVQLRTIYTFFLASAAFVLTSYKTLAQEYPAGNWAGELNFGGATSHISIFSFSTDGSKGKVLVSMPSSGMHDLQAGRVEMEGDSLWVSFRDHMMSYTYAGLYRKRDEEITGTLAVAAAGIKVPLVLKPESINNIRPNRPQTPQAPFPYTVLPTAFSGGDESITISGTITAPKGKKEVPGVVLISGSGPHNRDGEQFFHKTFLVLADELTKRGFAVLRYDERGVGESSGKYTGNFTEDFARDADAAVKALRADKRIKVKDVYVIGHSEGTLMAQIVAAQDSSVAGVVLLAAAGLPGPEFNKAQDLALLKARGKSEESQETQIMFKTYDIVAASADSITAVANLHTWFNEAEVDPQYRAMFIAPVMNPWRFHSLHFDPTPYQHKIKAPVLAITGENDLQTPAKPNFAALKAGLLAGGNNNFTGVILPELNHFMQNSITGAYDEPYTLEETFSTETLKTIGDWLEKQSMDRADAKASKASKTK